MMHLTIFRSNVKISAHYITKGKTMTKENANPNEKELMLLSKEEEAFLLKYRKLSDESKAEIKSFFAVFDAQAKAEAAKQKYEKYS